MTRLQRADDAGLAAAAQVIRAGGVVALPTDTVYGLAVDPTLPGATDLLFAAKGRSRQVPIAVLVADAEQAWVLAEAPLPGIAAELAARHWPGALTLVVGRAPGWPADLGDDEGRLGLRCPDHRWVRALCREVGPLATTSANLHGQPTPVDAAGVAAVLGWAVGLVIDGGTCRGEPSTVVDCTMARPVIRRPGRLSAADLGLDLGLDLGPEVGPDVGPDLGPDPA